MNKPLILSAVMAAALPLSAAASIPLTERPVYRALDACEAAIRAEFGAPAETREAFRERDADGTQQIYVNVASRGEDATQHMRVTCRTSALGNRVLEFHAEAGRWIEATEKRG